MKKNPNPTQAAVKYPHESATPTAPPSWPLLVAGASSAMIAAPNPYPKAATAQYKLIKINLILIDLGSCQVSHMLVMLELPIFFGSSAHSGCGCRREKSEVVGLLPPCNVIRLPHTDKIKKRGAPERLEIYHRSDLV